MALRPPAYLALVVYSMELGTINSPVRLRGRVSLEKGPFDELGRWFHRPTAMWRDGPTLSYAALCRWVEPLSGIKVPAPR